MVPQDPFLFGEPLKENLTYDDPNRALDEICRGKLRRFKTDHRGSRKNSKPRGERGVTLSEARSKRHWPEA